MACETVPLQHARTDEYDEFNFLSSIRPGMECDVFSIHTIIPIATTILLCGWDVMQIFRRNPTARDWNLPRSISQVYRMQKTQLSLSYYARGCFSYFYPGETTRFKPYYVDAGHQEDLVKEIQQLQIILFCIMPTRGITITPMLKLLSVVKPL